MKHIYFTILVFFTFATVGHTQTYSYMVEEWNFTKGSLNSESEGGLYLGFVNTDSDDDGSDDQYRVTLATNQSFGGRPDISKVMNTGKTHVSFTIADADYTAGATALGGSGTVNIILRLLDNGTDRNQNGDLALRVAPASNGLVVGGAGGTTTFNAGTLVDGYIINESLTFGVTFDHDNSMYAYWVGDPTGTEGFTSGAWTPGDIGAYQWGMQKTQAGDYMNLDQIKIVHEISTAPEEASLALATKNDKVVISADESTTEDKRIHSLTVNAGFTLTIAGGHELIIDGDLVLEGTIDINGYSGLVTNGSISGSGSVIKRRPVTFSDTEGRYSIVGSSVAGATTDDLGGIVYKYDETVAYVGGQERFVKVTSAETMEPGVGYFTANLGSTSFTGLPTTGDVSRTLVYDEANDGASNAGWNLVANPYPASIELNSFLSANAAVEGAVYLWDDGGSNTTQRTNSDYITVNAAGATGGSARATDWDGYIRAEQGFFVKAKEAGTLKFTNLMKAAGDNNRNNATGFFRSTSAKRELRVEISNDEYTSDLLVALTPRATIGVDRMFDAPKLKSNDNLQLYSYIEGQLDVYAIQALPQNIIGHEMELGIDAKEAGTYTLNFENSMSLDEIYLVDNELEVKVDLNNQSSYTFSTGSISNDQRFSILFSSAILSLEEDLTSSDINIQYYPSGLILSSSVGLLDFASVSILDLSGRGLYHRELQGFTNEEISFDFQSNDIYLIRVITQNGAFTNKISFK